MMIKEEKSDSMFKDQLYIVSMINMQNKIIEYIAMKKDINLIFKTMCQYYGHKIIFLDINYKVLYPKNEKDLNEVVSKIEYNYSFIKKEYMKNGYCLLDVENKKSITMPIQINGLNYGIIVADYVEDELQKSIDILHSITNLCTLIFTKHSRTLELELVRKQEYIGDLITWNFRSDEVALKMGLDIGWNILNKNKMIIVNLNIIQESIKGSTKEFTKLINGKLYDKVEDIVKEENELNLMGIRSDIFVILLENNGENSYERSRHLGNKILNVCKENLIGSISIGISGDIKNYKSIPNAYTQAMDSAKIGRQFWGVDKVINFEDIGFYSVFRDFLSSKQYKTIRNHIFDKLKKYDNYTGQDLYITLKHLIYNNMNTEKTAKDMFLHKNTINYRKRKIVEILGYEPWNMPYIFNTLMYIISDYFEL